MLICGIGKRTSRGRSLPFIAFAISLLFLAAAVAPQQASAASSETTTDTAADSQHRLALEASPYLRQHADNPVDWYPWGEEALDRAVAENKPLVIFTAADGSPLGRT